MALIEAGSKLRLVTLLPARSKAKIGFTIEIKISSKRYVLYYEALLYTWGSDYDTVAISV